MRIAILTSHPIQYQAPWFRELATHVELKVYFAHKPDAAAQGKGFGISITWDVDLLSGYDYEFLTNIATNPSTSKFFGCDTPEIASLIREKRFDAVIVCGWQLKSFWQAVLACNESRVPVLVRGDSQLSTPRSTVKKLVKLFIYRQMLKRFDGFLTVGERNADYLRYYGVKDTKLFSAPHFIDNEWFSEKATEAQVDVTSLRDDWNARERDLVILFVGKLIPEKGIDDLLTAYASIQPQGGFRMVVIGSGVLEESLVTRASEFDPSILFVGFKNQSELPIFYAAADVLVLPSVSETWGLVVNEAMACGTPAIVSDACGCAPDLIDEGTGFSFPVGNISALAECLNQMAQLKKVEHNWQPALSQKLLQYSVEACVKGTLVAMGEVLKVQKR